MKKYMNKAVDLTKGNVFRNVVYLAWPMVVGNVLQNAFNVVDMIFVGRLGPDAIGAVAICGMLMQITWTLLVGVSIGTTAMVARFFGGGDVPAAGRTAMQSLALGVLVSLILVVLDNTVGEGILKALGATDAVLSLGAGYLHIVFNGSFTLILFFLASSIMRGVGDSLTPMLIMGISTAINIALDPLLIFGIWIFPEMGVRGAALATVIAQGTGMVAGLAVLFTGRTRVRVDIRRFKIDFQIIMRMLRISIPGTMQGAVRSVANLILMSIVTSYGVHVLAAYGIGLRLDLIAMMPGWALGGAAATLVGQNLGAGEPVRAERSAWAATAIYAGILAIAGAVFLAFSDGVIGIFNTQPQIVKYGSQYLRLRTATYLFLASSMVLASSLNGAGDTIFPMIILGVSLVGVQLPLAFLLPRAMGGNPLGIWLSIAAAYAVQGIAMAVWFAAGRWKRRTV